jgi:hypothetical protein
MMKYYKDTNNLIHAIEEGFEYLLPAGCVEITKDEVDSIVNPPLPPKTPEQIEAEFVAEVQSRLDTFARTRGYDGILSACTYTASVNLKFSSEGQYCVQARDATWAKCYEILGAVQSGTRQTPTWEELEAELPVLEWPN